MLHYAKVSAKQAEVSFSVVPFLRGTRRREQEGESCLHGFLVRLDAPGDGVTLIDLDPSDDVRLHTESTVSARWEEAAAGRLCVRFAHTLLWISSCSMPAMISSYQGPVIR